MRLIERRKKVFYFTNKHSHTNRFLFKCTKRPPLNSRGVPHTKMLQSINMKFVVTFTCVVSPFPAVCRLLSPCLSLLLFFILSISLHFSPVCCFILHHHQPPFNHCHHHLTTSKTLLPTPTLCSGSFECRENQNHFGTLASAERNLLKRNLTNQPATIVKLNKFSKLLYNFALKCATLVTLEEGSKS